MAHDPVVDPVVRDAEHLEPHFVHEGQEAATRDRLATMARDGKRPNVLVILFDDVGWGDFGCYGGGAAVGAPTPNIDKLARRGLMLTSCYSEPSCTPSRASLMTGRLPMRHGLLRPPMYGEAGGLDGEVTIAELLSDAGYVTQAVGKWHMGENTASQPQNVGFDDFYGFLSVSDMYTEWRDPYFFPEIAYSEARTKWVENQPFNKCFVHATRGGDVETVEEVTIPVLSELDDKWAGYSIDFMRRQASADQPWFLYHCTRGAHFDNYPLEKFLGSSPARHPYKDTIIELDDIVGRLVATLEETGQLEDTMIFLSSDNGPEMSSWPDSAFTPFRSAKGSTWEGGQRVPGIVVWPGMIEADRVSDGLFSQMDLFSTMLRLARASEATPSDRFIDGVDQTSFLLGSDGLSNRKHIYYWLGSTFSALRVGEWKFMIASTSDDDTDVHNPSGFSGVTQKYTYARLYNLYLDPKETKSYMIRKLPYVEAFQRAMFAHVASFAKYPPKQVVGGVG
jgi:arylsulfatase